MSDAKWNSHVHVYQKNPQASYHMNDACRVNYIDFLTGERLPLVRVDLREFLEALGKGRVCHKCLPKERQLRPMRRRA